MIDVQLLNRPVRYVAIESLPTASGGECVFLGRTRQETDRSRGRLMRLSYEAYGSMAEVVLRDLADAATQRFGCSVVRIHHAVGEVPPGEASVLVQVACGHRSEAFEACRFLIDQLKARAPIWKREEWEDGATWAPGTAGPGTAVGDQAARPREGSCTPR
ncbi:MAG: molybdenum cofactor biosynthesis protein MoaE [Phycisphaerales bacterium]|nr:molybdenum cofactor biosynthesis protein MoaE [Phycisphaerales bacterium]MCI0630081.1 molybdenum cofactor biosynthesis protein MoaE [Phycisphaerales bacterium]MCI0675245.1 molybdenum cofactor biosynthesis protein MoaE [Phycisphaerales bacterium]